MSIRVALGRELSVVLLFALSSACGDAADSSPRFWHHCVVDGEGLASISYDDGRRLEHRLTECSFWSSSGDTGTFLGLSIHDHETPRWLFGPGFTIRAKVEDAETVNGRSMIDLGSFDVVPSDLDFGSDHLAERQQADSARPPGTADVYYAEDTAVPPRRLFTSMSGGSLLLSGAVSLGDRDSSNIEVTLGELRLTAEGAVVAETITGTGHGRVVVTAYENTCRPYAERIVHLATSAGCQGAGTPAEELETKCNQFVAQHVQPASCLPQYVAYLECASRATMCDPCLDVYEGLKSCFCGRFPESCP